MFTTETLLRTLIFLVHLILRKKAILFPEVAIYSPVHAIINVGGIRMIIESRYAARIDEFHGHLQNRLRPY